MNVYKTDLENINSNLNFYRHEIKKLVEYKTTGFIGERPVDADTMKTIDDRIRMYLDSFKHYKKQSFSAIKKYNSMETLLENNNTLKGGDNMDINKIALEVENDFYEGDMILESGDVTYQYTTRSYWNNKIENNFLGSYPVTVERLEDYENFIQVLVSDSMENNVKIDFSLSFNEWKQGKKKIDEKRELKLNKFLNKKGFSQYVLDYFSQQIRTEKTVFLTVSDRVQHITGMSYYSTMDWTSMSGSSCQDPRNEYEECTRLLGSLHDDKMLIVFMHEKLDDLEDLEEKMLARSIGRIIHLDGQQYLITTKNYGSMENKDIFENSVRKLNDFNIFTMKQMETLNSEPHSESANGSVEIEEEDEVNIYTTIDEYVSCECPMCDGSGEYTVYTRNDREVEVDCPACNGSGEYEVNVYIDIDEYVTVSDVEEVLPYNENYSHRGNKIVIRIDKEVLGINE